MNHLLIGTNFVTPLEKSDHRLPSIFWELEDEGRNDGPFLQLGFLLLLGRHLGGIQVGNHSASKPEMDLASSAGRARAQHAPVGG